MRIKGAIRLAVLATVVVGVLGVGPGRADAATATKVTRTSRAFKGFIQVLHINPGSPPDFMCPITGSDTRSTTATIPNASIGAGRTFPCVQGNERVTMSYGIINQTARVPNLSTGRHQISLSFTRDGSQFFGCGTASRFSSLATVVTNTFVQTEVSDGTSGAGVCSDLFVQWSIGYTEGWSAT